MWADVTELSGTRLPECRGMVYRFMLFLTSDPDATDELGQETLRVAVLKANPRKKRIHYGPWVSSIARSLLRNYLPNQGRT